MIVYVIEDDRAVRSALTVFLEEEGYDVCPFGNAASFLAGATPTADDLILLDLGLPDISGTELHALLRKKGVTSQVVAISGLRSGPFEAAVQEIKPIAAFRKPLDLPALLSGMTAALRT